MGAKRLGAFLALSITFYAGGSIERWVGNAYGAKEYVPYFQDEPIQPLDPPTGLDSQRVELGKKLFDDKRLSANDTISCASCHMIDKGGALDTPHPLPGVSGKAVPINVPTVLGSSLNASQFWNGRVEKLEDQIEGPIHNPDEMGSTWPEIAKKLSVDPEYLKYFMATYHTPPNQDNIKDAIATFERSLVPIDAPFDRFLRGEKGAISAEAEAGYKDFKDLGCVSCHQGANIGGNMVQKFGVMGDYFKDRGNIIEQDYGYYTVSHDEADRYFFKVPSLRNVALTAPYFHDGSATTLEQAVDTMAKYQLGRTLSPEERSNIVAFLGSLTGTLPTSYNGNKP